MLSRVMHSTLLFAVMLGFPGTSFTQFGTGTPVNAEPLVNGPAPARDLAGVWTRISPEGAFRSGSTWTPDPPELTAWGEARFATSRNSNAGGFALAETNDPVLTRCYPPGVPRVYFHPYPFEIVYTDTQMIMLYTRPGASPAGTEAPGEFDLVQRERLFSTAKPIQPSLHEPGWRL